MKKILAVVILFLSPLSLGSEVDCLAQNIYWEARNQSINGMYAVAKVTLNRVRDSRWPSTVCAVVKQRKLRGGSWICQFSWYCDGLSDHPTHRESWNMAKLIATVTIEYGTEEQFLNKTYWYHSNKVNPYWASAYNPTRVIGDHIFYTEE